MRNLSYIEYYDVQYLLKQEENNLIEVYNQATSFSERELLLDQILLFKKNIKNIQKAISCTSLTEVLKKIKA